MNAPFRLTSLAQGGDFGCIPAPSVRLGMLAKMPETRPYADMMVGIETGDDAAVHRSNETQAPTANTRTASRPA